MFGIKTLDKKLKEAEKKNEKANKMTLEQRRELRNKKAIQIKDLLGDVTPFETYGILELVKNSLNRTIDMAQMLDTLRKH